MEYPEHEKMKKVESQSLAIGQFLEWLQENGLIICEFTEQGQYHGEGYFPVHKHIEQWIADYFQIDLNVVEKEKQHMLVTIRGEV